MLSTVVATSVFVTVFAFIVQYREWLDFHRSFVYRVAPGPCKQIAEDKGSEDMTYIGAGTVLMSSGFGRGASDWKIKSLNLNTSKMVDMQIRGAPSREDFMMSPHGISTWSDSKGQIYLYVVTHTKTEDKVEVFKLKSNNVLKYKRTITDPKFKYMNDLVAVGRDKFYITRCLQYRDWWRHNVEIFGQRHWGGVLYFDGQRAREVVTDLFVPNGINISPDKKMVFVAEVGSRKIQGYQRSESNALVKVWEKDVKTIVDNIDVDPLTGDLWVGCHPVAYRIFLPFPIFRFTPPSQVLRLKMEDNMIADIEEIYADDGSELRGSTVATYAEGKLVIGTVAKETVMCDVNYLS